MVNDKMNLDGNEKRENMEKKQVFQYAVPPVDILEDEGKITMWFEIPGTDVENVHIEVKDKIMNVQADSSLKYGEKTIRFSREFQLSDAVDIAGIKAEVENGVLTLTLPKAECSKIHKVKIS